MSDTTMIKTAFFAASRAVVWSFLTDKDKLALWFYGAESDLTAGEDYILVGVDDDGNKVKKCWGRVLEMEKPGRLVYSFTITPLDGVMTTVTWTLEEITGEETTGGTKLTLEHDGVAAAGLGLLMGLDSGWDRHLGQLRNAVSGA